MPNSDCLTKERSEIGCHELVFSPITLESKELINSYTKPWGAECSDLSFANLFIWGTGGKMEYAEKNNVLYIKLSFDGVPTYLWAPIPKKGADVKYCLAVQTGIAYLQELGVEPTFRSVCEPFLSMMQKACPQLHTLPTEVAWDYVYEMEKLATLKGKKLHGKRNHINKFLSLYPEYEYKKLDSSMVEACMALYAIWMEEKEAPKELLEEKKSVLLALQNMEALDLVGGALFVEGNLVAFTLGERVLPDMQLVHIEKADYAYEGAGPMINQQYVLHECTDVTLINREEDMGVEGMRKAKRSYYPVKMVEKYLLSLKDMSGVKNLWGKEEE